MNSFNNAFSFNLDLLLRSLNFNNHDILYILISNNRTVKKTRIQKHKVIKRAIPNLNLLNSLPEYKGIFIMITNSII